MIFEKSLVCFVIVLFISKSLSLCKNPTSKKSISLNPYAVYIVDTYGLMHKNKVLNYFNILNNNLSNDIYIGFHSHNNFQLSFANSIELVELTTIRFFTFWYGKRSWKFKYGTYNRLLK